MPLLNHDGDAKAAAEALSNRGFGSWLDDDEVEHPNPPPKDWADRHKSSVSPSGSPAASPAPWPPLRFREPPPLLPFPVEVFPPRLQRFCREVAATMLAPLDFVGAAMLAVAGAAIGQSYNIKLKHGWFEAALLYVILVAPPGKTKSPVIRAAVKPLTEIDARLRKESEEAREAWIETKKAHDKDPDNNPPPGPEPPQRRAIIKDITRESVAIILKDNLRGVLCDPDEASAWVASFNEYKGKGGSDRQFWLSIWSCIPISVDRKGGRETIYVPFPFASMLGGLPPSKLSALRDDRNQDDGLVERILFVYPEEFPAQHWTEVELSEEADRDWAEAIGKLFDTPMRLKDEVEVPNVIGFTDPAKQCWVEWFNAHADETEAPEFSDRQAGAWSKMRAHAARFAEILARLRWACEPPPPPSPGPRFAMVTGLDESTKSDVEGAIELATYFKSHLLRVIHQMTGGIDNADVRAIAEWIRRKGLTEFRAHDVGADLRRFRNNSKALDAALAGLVEVGAIRPKREDRHPSTPGRKPTDAYEVHPEFLSTRAPRNTQNTQNGPPEPAADSISGNSGNSWRAQESQSADQPHEQSVAPADGELEEGDI
jgi:hypothetical protein